MKFISTGENMIKKAIMALVSLTSITAQAGEVWFKSGPRLFRMEVPMSQDEISNLSHNEKIELLRQYEIKEYEDLRFKGHEESDGQGSKPSKAPSTFTDIRQKNLKRPNWTESAPPAVAQWTDVPSRTPNGSLTER